MRIDITSLSSQAKWASGRIDGPATDYEDLPWNGSDGDPRGFVRLGQIRLEDGTSRSALWTHPKWVDGGTIKGWHPAVVVPAGAAFEADVGFKAGAGAGSVTFLVFGHYDENGRRIIAELVRLDKAYTGRLERISADLSHLAGKEVGLELRVDAGPSSAQDWAVWVDARVAEVGQRREGLVARASRSSEGAGEENLGTTTERPAGHDDYVCSVQTRKVTQVFSDSLLLDPTSDVVWPGSAIDGSTISNGQYRPIEGARAPVTLSISLATNPGQSSAITVQDPKPSTVRDSLGELYRRVAPQSTPAQVNYEVLEVHSENQLKLALGVNYDSGPYRVSGRFNFDQSSVTNKYAVRFLQKYYTIDVDPPAIDSFFVNGQPINQDDMYVATINYGRLLLYTIESEANKTTIEAAIKAAYTGVGDASLEEKYNSILQSSRMNVLVLGGSSEDGVHVITDGLAGVKNYIQSGANFGPNSPSVPLSYKLRYMSDKAVGNLLMTTTYKERNCVKATGRVRVKDIFIKCVDVGDDPGSNLDIYGKISVDVFNPGFVEGRVMWERNSDNYISIGGGGEQGEEIRPGSEYVITFTNLQEALRSAYIRLTADIWDQDTFGSDDHLGTQSKDVLLSEAVPDPNGELGSPDARSATASFELGESEQKVQVGFTVEPF